MSAATVTDTDVLTVVKLLAAGRSLPMVAAATRLSRDQVTEIGSRHGWPDTTRLKAATRRLVTAIDNSARITEREPETSRPARPAKPTPPADQPPGGTRTCTKCDTTKPVEAFSRDPARSGGRRNECNACRIKYNRPRPYDLSKAVLSRARHRAVARVVAENQDTFARYYEQELAKAAAEAEALAAVAAGKTSAGENDHGHPAATPLLKPGRRLVDQDVTDRLREDVGRCPLCINSHDTDHTCPNCGRTKERTVA